jgi:hypothetical protein
MPLFIHTNARIGFLDIGGRRLYFFPDRFLVRGNADLRAVRYQDLKVEANTVRFSEEGGVPRAARVIGQTWRCVNGSGGPDRRFNNNDEIPEVLYRTLVLSEPSGLGVNLQLSTDGLAPTCVKLLESVRTAVSNLED